MPLEAKEHWWCRDVTNMSRPLRERLPLRQSGMGQESYENTVISSDWSVLRQPQLLLENVKDILKGILYLLFIDLSILLSPNI